MSIDYLPLLLLSPLVALLLVLYVIARIAEFGIGLALRLGRWALRFLSIEQTNVEDGRSEGRPR